MLFLRVYKSRKEDKIINKTKFLSLKKEIIVKYNNVSIAITKKIICLSLIGLLFFRNWFIKKSKLRKKFGDGSKVYRIID